MFTRRSSRSATAPASGPSSRAGNSDVSQTPLTAALDAAIPRLARMTASAVSASRLSQSPRLDSDVAIHRRRKGLMDSTLPPAVSPGNRKVTALGYRSRLRHAAYVGRNALAHGDLDRDAWPPVRWPTAARGYPTAAGGTCGAPHGPAAPLCRGAGAGPRACVNRPRWTTDGSGTNSPTAGSPMVQPTTAARSRTTGAAATTGPLHAAPPAVRLPAGS